MQKLSDTAADVFFGHEEITKKPQFEFVPNCKSGRILNYQ